MRMPPLDRHARGLPRALSRFGRTPTEKTVLLVVGALLAYGLGRWTAPAPGAGSTHSGGAIPDTVRGTPLVLDGDTLDFQGLRLRLHGIDAFERDQTCKGRDGTSYSCGMAAKASLVAAIGNSLVSCVKRDVDRYGRMVAACRAGETDIAAAVVLDGNALAYRRYSGDYIDEENVARATRSGVWAGAFEAPWEYRQRGREGERR